MGLLLAGLADRSRLVAAATADRLHQTQRASLFPEAASLIDGLVGAGALAACWSGAGPSILGFCDSADAPRVRQAGASLMAEVGVPGRALHLYADTKGLVVEPIT
jgi:homoserine kinase